MRGPNNILFLCGIALLAVVASGQPEHYTYHNHVFHDEGYQGISEILNDVNQSAIAALPSIKNQGLNLFGFYVALRELYLTGGFAANLNFNAVILAQPIIPDFQYQELILALENSRYEIKNGDAFVRRVKALEKLSEAEVLVYEPWMIELITTFGEKADNAKDVAFAVPELGKYLIAADYNRTHYTNGTFLRNAIGNWSEEQFADESNRASFTNPLVVTHHTIGPEKFEMLADTLEMQPFQTKFGMLKRDKEFYRFYQNGINEAIADADISLTLMTGTKNAFENVMNTINVNDTLFGQLVYADLQSSANSVTITDMPGQPISARYEKSIKETNKILAEIWAKLGNNEVKDKFIKYAQAALNTSIGGLEGVKNAFIAGARLIKNLGGSVDNAIEKCRQIKDMVVADQDAYTKFDSAVQIVLKLNRTNSQGRQGYKLLFEQYLENNAMDNLPLFGSSQFQDVATMEGFINEINKQNPDEFRPVIDNLIKKKISLYDLGRLAKDSAFSRNSKRNFGIRISEERAVIIKSALQKIADLSNDRREDMLSYLTSIKQILNTNNSKNILSSFSEIMKLSRDGKYLDVNDAYKHISIVTSGSKHTRDVRLAPFKGLESMIGQNGSYMEVFTAMQSLIEDTRTTSSKCKFIEDFFPGLQNVDSIAEAFGIKTDNIARYVEDTVFVDVLIELLRQSRSYVELRKLLDFHTLYTVDKKDPMNSPNLIADMIVHLGQRGWKSELRQPGK